MKYAVHFSLFCKHPAIGAIVRYGRARIIGLESQIFRPKSELTRSKMIPVLVYTVCIQVTYQRRNLCGRLGFKRQEDYFKGGRLHRRILQQYVE